MDDSKFQGGISAVAESLRGLKAQTSAQQRGLTDAQKLEALAQARDVAGFAAKFAREADLSARDVLRELSMGPNVVPFLTMAALAASAEMLTRHVGELQKLIASVIRG